jgi:hypothetical protein
MNKITISCFALLITISAFPQAGKDLMIGSHLDLIRSDNAGHFEKAQAGVELNYFLSRQFTATAGGEYWTDGDEVSFVLGARWHPVPEAFIRLRGLIGANDFSIGGGWAKPLNDNWRFEAMADVYTEGRIAIRAGFAYILPRHH